MDWLFKTDLFVPDDYRKTIFDIDYDGLYANGIRLLLVDLDNTLIPYDQSEPDQRIIKLFRDLKSFGFEVVIISNNHKKRVRRFAESLDVHFIAGAKKPLKCGFREIMRSYPEYDKRDICVIGDQFMTDVLGAKRMGFMAIVVDAIKRKTEKWFTKLNRKLEKRVLLRMKKQNNAIYRKLNLEEKR